MVLRQDEALLLDDPMLSSTSVYQNSFHSSGIEMQRADVVYEDTNSEDCQIVSSSTSGFVCKWEDCYQNYDSQGTLVKHIEKCHVEQKRGELGEPNW